MLTNLGSVVEIVQLGGHQGEQLLLLEGVHLAAASTFTWTYRAISALQRLPLLVVATLPNDHRPIPAIRAPTRGQPNDGFQVCSGQRPSNAGR